MKNEPEQRQGLFQTVVNQHGQYSIWPVERAIPHGWRPVADAGTRDQCLEYIEANWKDIRPNESEVATWSRPQER